MLLIFRLCTILLARFRRTDGSDDLFALSEKKKHHPRKISVWRTAFWGFLFLATLVSIEFLALGVGTYYFLAADLPYPSPEAMASMPQSTRIFDRNGEFLYEVHGDVKRRFVPLAEIPVYLQEATIAIEDKNFYKHPGFDLWAITRAAYINFRNHGVSQGASTITQQLARTMFLEQDRVYTRKIKELILAVQIEHLYSKDKILEMYLNNIPYGSVAYGVSAAAEIYLDKAVSDINLAEAVHLAALPKAPSDYSPFGSNKEALFARGQSVIQAMHDTGAISDAEFNYALAQARPDFVSAPTIIKAPHFVFYVLDELKNEYGEAMIRDGGLDIYTSLDLSLQTEAEKIVKTWGEKNEKKYGTGNASLVAVAPDTGEILVMVGSRDYYDEKNGAFNVSTSPRQPGSSFKPYVYAAAISNGLSPEDFIMDNQTNFAGYNYGVSYIPRNYDGQFHGRVTIRTALAGSLNIPAVKVLVETGINKTIDLAENMGISTLGDRKRFGPALALGGGEVKLLEHTAAFGIFGNGGLRQKTNPILKITNRDKAVVYEKAEEAGTQVMDEMTAYWINDVLSDAKARQYVFGANSKLEIPGEKVAAKTGTSQDFHDAWTVGYTPSLAVGVWSGNNDNSPMYYGANGYVVATPIWREFMTLALKQVKNKDFAKLEDVSRDKLTRKKMEAVEKTSLTLLLDNPSAPALSAENNLETDIVATEDIKFDQGKISIAPPPINQLDSLVIWHPTETSLININIKPLGMTE